jgi:hypothetical protein
VLAIHEIASSTIWVVAYVEEMDVEPFTVRGQLK